MGAQLKHIVFDAKLEPTGLDSKMMPAGSANWDMMTDKYYMTIPSETKTKGTNLYTKTFITYRAS